MNLRKHVSTLALGVAALLLLSSAFTAAAHASSGRIQGKIQFLNKNGGFCPTGQACTGATYTQSQFNVQTGLPYVIVFLNRSSDNAGLGLNTADASGNYLIDWTSSDTGNVPAYLSVYYDDANGHFWFTTVSAPHNLYISNINVTVTNGTSSSNPQLFNASTGNTPNPVANVYWAAQMAWSSLSTSNRMLTWFNSVEVLAFDTGNVTGCTTSCSKPWFRNMSSGLPAWGDQYATIVLDGAAGTPYNPQERMMHELGHIADFISGPNQGKLGFTSYMYDGTDGWNYTSSEYRPSAMAEGLGTFVASTALYTQAATAPRTCFANGNGSSSPDVRQCWGSGVPAWADLEFSMDGSCSGTVGRWPLNHMRFFWDIYDSTADKRDASNMPLYRIFDTMAAWSCPSYPACYGNGQLHDAYTFVPSTLNLAQATLSSTELDDANAWDFHTAMLNAFGTGFDVQGAYFANCLGYF